MKDESCICFLQWALPQLHMRWTGFRKVRGQVCKRLGRRLEDLQLSDFKSYRMYLQHNPLEWHILDSLCRITISRFYRDQGIFQSLYSEVFPNLISIAKRQHDTTLSCWCIGAASGEEPYSLSLLWELSDLQMHETDLRILATEVDQLMINRAMQACYPASSIRELPPKMKNLAFKRKDEQFCLKERFKKRVQFLQQDIRQEQPDTTFHLILCRNLVFTYFSQELQEQIAQQIVKRLKPGGCLVIGSHEKLPGSLPGLASWLHGQKISRRAG
jgi:chemotaxis protein methyltransferase CheR